MQHCAGEDIVFLVVVAGRKQKNALLSEILKNDCRIVHSIYGKGTIQEHVLVEMLGLVPEENKVVITCILQKSKVEEIFELLLNKFKFCKPNTGIAFTIPISGLSI